MKKLLALLLVLAALFCVFAGCAKTDTTTPSGETQSSDSSADTDETAQTETSGKKFKIGFSQCTMKHGWRVCMADGNIDWAKENWPDAEIVFTNADDSEVQQVQDMEDLIAAGCDLILISPLTSEALTDVCQRALDQGIYVVTIDRMVNCDVTAHIGGENGKVTNAIEAQGVQTDAVNSIKVQGVDAKLTGGKGTVVECAGTSGTSVTNDRHDGFANALEGTDIQIIDSQDCDFARANAMEYIEDVLSKYDPSEITAIYCHNDEMAMGATGRGRSRQNHDLQL